MTIEQAREPIADSDECGSGNARHDPVGGSSAKPLRDAEHAQNARPRVDATILQSGSRPTGPAMPVATFGVGFSARSATVGPKDEPVDDDDMDPREDDRQSHEHEDISRSRRRHAAPSAAAVPRPG